MHMEEQVFLLTFVTLLIDLLGKTYLLNCIIDYVRTIDKLPLVAATTGISAIMLHSGIYFETDLLTKSMKSM